MALDPHCSVKGHSPILRPTHSDVLNVRAAQSSNSESPEIESAVSNDGERRRKPLLKRLRSQKMSAKLGKISFRSIF